MRLATIALAALALAGCSREPVRPDGSNEPAAEPQPESVEQIMFTAFEMTPTITPLKTLQEAGRVTGCIDVSGGVVCHIRRLSIGGGVDPIEASAIFKDGVLDGISLLTLPDQAPTVVGTLTSNYGQPTGVTDGPNGEIDYAFWTFKQGTLLYKHRDEEAPNRSRVLFAVKSQR